MEVPPARAILVFGAGEDVREEDRDVVRTLGREEMRVPAADGGGLGDAVREVDGDELVGIGSWRAEG